MHATDCKVQTNQKPIQIVKYLQPSGEPGRAYGSLYAILRLYPKNLRNIKAPS